MTSELHGPQMVVEAVEVARTVRDRLRIAQDRYKHWADTKRRHLEFVVGDLVFLRISPTRGLIRFGCRGKLSPRFIRPFPNRGASWRGCLPPDFTRFIGCSASSFPCVATTEMHRRPDTSYGLLRDRGSSGPYL